MKKLAEREERLLEQRERLEEELRRLEVEREAAERDALLKERRRAARERLRMRLPSSEGQVQAEYVRSRGKAHGPYWYHYWYEDGKQRKRYVGKRLDGAAAEALALREFRAYAREQRAREVEALREGVRVPSREPLLVGGTGMTEAEFRAYSERVGELVGMAPEDYTPRRWETPLG